MVGALATQVFLDTYATHGIRPDMAREVFEEYSGPAFAARLAETRRRFVLAVTGRAIVGFAELLLPRRPLLAGSSRQQKSARKRYDIVSVAW